MYIGYFLFLMANLPEITALDVQIQRSGGQTFRTILSSSHMQKEKPSELKNDKSEYASLSLVRENGHLRQELAHCKSSLQAMAIFWEKSQKAFLDLQTALQELSTKLDLVDRSLLAEMGIDADEAEDVCRI